MQLTQILTGDPFDHAAIARFHAVANAIDALIIEVNPAEERARFAAIRREEVAVGRARLIAGLEQIGVVVACHPLSLSLDRHDNRRAVQSFADLRVSGNEAKFRPLQVDPDPVATALLQADFHAPVCVSLADHADGHVTGGGRPDHSNR